MPELICCDTTATVVPATAIAGGQAARMRELEKALAERDAELVELRAERADDAKMERCMQQLQGAWTWRRGGRRLGAA